VPVQVAGRTLRASAGTFWQVHPYAADAYASAMLEMLRPAPGERVLELFSGAGALTVVLADAVGPTGAVIAVESAAAAVQDARANLAARDWVDIQRARVDERYLAEVTDRPDLVVLDPPRAGLGAAATRAMLALGPRAVCYVACDPASLARDVRAAVDAGWRLAALRAYDAFPMTAHVECVAHLIPPQ
jgi:tRNA/tmRNA/rRNA uracil-C5-methylase (TrmA/RlmC/RlmD family)